MPLVPGSRLGPYEILAAIGAGGMGEVYRARDPKLNRDVALKVLPASVAADPDRLARFRREAQVLASLNHPNIGHIYGFEDSGTTHALVLELIEGPTLADRIAQGPIPLAEALPIARQITDALEAAHEQGIIHRDLKPANIKVRPDGTVKVLDFGLAKALDPADASSADAMSSPTLTNRATLLGMILGTAAYMAPEQARGLALDRRADIWAVGVVLYEMLTGRRAFDGDDVSSTLASVLKDDVQWAALPADIPTPVRRLLRRCLEKDPKRRLSSIGDARLELDEAQSPLDPDDGNATRFNLAAANRGSGWRLFRPWLVIPLLVAGAVAATWWLKPPLPVRHVVARFQYALPDGQTFTRAGRHVIAVSPDGTKIAYVANQQLYLKAMDQLEAQPIRGTNEGPYEPVFSPDGQWLAYFVPANAFGGAAATLRKIAIGGGGPVTLCRTASGPYGASWRNGMIAFGQYLSGALSEIQIVPDIGGTPRTLAAVDPKEGVAAQPQLLDDGRHVLFTVLSPGAREEGQIVVQAFDGSPHKTLLTGGTNAQVLATGQLVTSTTPRSSGCHSMRSDSLSPVGRYRLSRV